MYRMSFPRFVLIGSEAWAALSEQPVDAARIDQESASAPARPASSADLLGKPERLGWVLHLCGNVTSSGLSFEVSAGGENVYHIELSSQGPVPRSPQ